VFSLSVSALPPSNEKFCVHACWSVCLKYDNGIAFSGRDGLRSDYDIVFSGRDGLWSDYDIVFSGRDGLWSDYDIVFSGRDGLWPDYDIVFSGRDGLWSDYDIMFSGRDGLWSDYDIVFSGRDGLWPALRPAQKLQYLHKQNEVFFLSWVVFHSLVICSGSVITVLSTRGFYSSVNLRVHPAYGPLAESLEKCVKSQVRLPKVFMSERNVIWLNLVMSSSADSLKNLNVNSHC
jgi:hypothetical protein